MQSCFGRFSARYRIYLISPPISLCSRNPEQYPVQRLLSRLTGVVIACAQPPQPRLRFLRPPRHLLKPDTQTSFFPFFFFVSNSLSTSDITATNKTSHLRYSALQLDLKAKAIRLIDILPGDQTAAIACRFQNHTLQDTTTYTALSYTWGGSNNTKEILHDGEASKVRDNL